MRKYTFTEKGRTFKRIDKKTARTAYKNGLTVIICPCNLRPFTPWHNTIIAICSKPQPRTASPPAGAYFIEWRYKALEKSMDNPTGAIFCPVS